MTSLYNRHCRRLGQENKMADFRLSTPELVEQVAVLSFLNGGEEGKKLYNGLVTGKVCYEVYKRLTVSKADTLRAVTILRISDYVKKHPKASEAQLKAAVEKEIKNFAEEVAKL